MSLTQSKRVIESFQPLIWRKKAKKSKSCFWSITLDNLGLTIGPLFCLDIARFSKSVNTVALELLGFLRRCVICVTPIVVFLSKSVNLLKKNHARARQRIRVRFGRRRERGRASTERRSRRCRCSCTTSRRWPHLSCLSQFGSSLAWTTSLLVSIRLSQLLLTNSSTELIPNV